MNIEKLKACIVFACSKGGDKLDPVKLNKVLWFTDAASFMDSGDSITGARYVRKPRGPVASVMHAAVRELTKQGAVVPGRRHDPELGLYFDEYVVKDDSLVQKLSQTELTYLEHSLKRVLAHTSDAISDRTHGEIWQLAADGEEIPLFTMFAERLGPITKEHIDAAFAD